MKIKQLIKKLSKLNQDAEVLLSSDTEGNNFNLLSEIYNTPGLKYIKEDFIDVLDKDDIEADGQDIYDKGKDCIVLYPK